MHKEALVYISFTIIWRNAIAVTHSTQSFGAYLTICNILLMSLIKKYLADIYGIFNVSAHASCDILLSTSLQFIVTSLINWILIGLDVFPLTNHHQARSVQSVPCELPPGTPHICYNHHNRELCKFFESSIKFSHRVHERKRFECNFLQSVQSYTWCSVSPTLQFYTMCNLTCNATCIT